LAAIFWHRAKGRHGEVKQMLAPVYARFTYGYETTDLRAARIMLDTIISFTY
jgi:predicted ATPase